MENQESDMSYLPSFSVTPLYVIDHVNKYRPAFGITLRMSGIPVVSLRVVFDFDNTRHPIILTPWKREAAMVEPTTFGYTRDMSTVPFESLDQILVNGLLQFIERNAPLSYKERNTLQSIVPRVAERIFAPLRSELTRDSLKSVCARVN